MTIEDKMKELSEVFDFLEGMEKMEYLVDMAKKAQGLPAELRNDQTKVYGCASETWVVVNRENGSVSVKTDSEAQIVRGMLYLLEQSFNGHSADEILAVDEQNVLNKLGLGSSITNRRMNGFASAILKIKEELQK